ncbi:methyltransferase domain-containing protein [Synechococcus sp. LTW-R]|uniref:methyltransferase domain-containing protein n=1 Tax=Synechococcus sp. LTW-R TaxID=2751170 RepID=UPI001C892DFD|nr:methyltransferase domain-containing protein [Synechococcus sp. LTW-R]
MIPDRSVDLIYACHVLEHFDRRSFPNVLREWFSKLKDGGILRLSVPNFESIVQVYISEGFQDGLSGLIGLLVGGQRDASDFHKMIFDYNLLSSSLLETGFSHCRLWDWRSTDHSCVDDYSQAYLPHLDKIDGRLMSLNVEAVK